MINEPNPDDFEAQMRQSEADMEELASMLESEADLLGLLAQEQGRELAAQAQEHLPLLAGGAAAVGLLLTLLLRRGGGGGDYAGDVPVRELDDDYVSLLARVIRHRLRQDDEMPLGEALATTLREQAPVLYRRPPQSQSSGSSWAGRLLSLGALAALGLGANYLAKQLTGQRLVDLATGGTSYDVDQKYPAPHGTAGGRVPDPSTSPAAAEALGREQPTASPQDPPPGTTGTPAAPEAPATPTDRTAPRSQPEAGSDEVHGTSDGETPTPNAAETETMLEQMPTAAAEPGTDLSQDQAEPQGDLPGEPPTSKKEDEKK